MCVCVCVREKGSRGGNTIVLALNASALQLPLFSWGPHSISNSRTRIHPQPTPEPLTPQENTHPSAVDMGKLRLVGQMLPTNMKKLNY